MLYDDMYMYLSLKCLSALILSFVCREYDKGKCRFDEPGR